MYANTHTNWISLCKIDLPTKLEIEVYGLYQQSEQIEVENFQQQQKNEGNLIGGALINRYQRNNGS